MQWSSSSVPSPVPAPPARKGRILVVDDDRLVLATVTHGLAQAGYEVIDADNGDDAILLARQHKPDLALLDIRMEGLSGFDVAAYLRESCQVPFLFLSAFNDEQTAAQVKALGALAYLVKPLDVGQILPAVDAAFAQVAARGASVASAAAGAAVGPGSGPAPAPLEGGAAERAAQPLGDIVAMAVGVLMHRYSLPRGEALDRLRRSAASEGVSVAVHAEKLVAAVELLAAPGR